MSGKDKISTKKEHDKPCIDEMKRLKKENERLTQENTLLKAGKEHLENKYKK